LVTFFDYFWTAKEHLLYFDCALFIFTYCVFCGKDSLIKALRGFNLEYTPSFRRKFKDVNRVYNFRIFDQCF